jgi:hypothetical protein
VTGPTGSGKTTTLYAALREVQARGVNVVTVEDPIEYRLPGIVQVQVHERAGLTFSKALRSIMRQDPDVILVGEIRDRETAEIAIQASLTGHLVLSTLHTNDAASAVTRLIDIGVPGYQIATAVKGVVAQRLLRRVCANCGAAGCDACEGSGFRGRIAIAEILVAGSEFERRVSAGASTESIAEAARAAGCVSLWESGLELVRAGQTTIDELRRVAAEPVRVVTEPAPASSSPRLRIGWRGQPDATSAPDTRQELTAAAAVLGAHIEVVPLDADLPSVDIVDVVVHEGPVAPRGGEPRSALVVALASDASSGEHVRTLARDADLVVPRGAHGRLLLATILALLRWRAR